MSGFKKCLLHNKEITILDADLYNTANGVSKGIDMSTKVIDTPGFAPVYNTKHEKKY